MKFKNAKNNSRFRAQAARVIVFAGLTIHLFTLFGGKTFDKPSKEISDDVTLVAQDYAQKLKDSPCIYFEEENNQLTLSNLYPYRTVDIEEYLAFNYLVIKTSDLTNLNLEKLKSESVNSLELDNVKGLENFDLTYYFPNLKNLSIINCDINSLLPSDDITYLSVQKCELYSLKHLTKFPNIYNLKIKDCNGTINGEGIETFNRLYSLSLINLNILDYSFFSNSDLLNHGTLEITKCNFTSLDTKYLSGLNITSLSISQVNQLNFSDVNNLENLTSLSLVLVGIDKIDFICKFPSLKKLNLAGNYITDLTPLELLPDLESLIISENRSLKSFESLYFLENLKKLVSKNSLFWITPEALVYLEESNIETDISENDIQVIQEISKISEELNISNEMENKEKIRLILDKVLTLFEYDYEADLESVRSYNKEALQTFLNGVGVCDSYATAISALCLLNNINARHITGYCIDYNAELYGYYENYSLGHAWNLIEDDGEYYIVDATWIDSLHEEMGIASLDISPYYMATEESLNYSRRAVGLPNVNIKLFEEEQEIRRQYHISSKDLFILLGLHTIYKLRKNYNNRNSITKKMVKNK